MNIMLPMKTILLSVLFFATSISGQTTNDDFLKKPHVLPSAERAYHAIYHELDSKTIHQHTTPMFGQLYVALIEDQFTFGGDLDEWPKSLFKDNERGCKPFMGANVHHMCNDAYFLVHQDMVKLKKTEFNRDSGQKDPDLNTICGSGEAAGFSSQVTGKELLYRYSHRIPMTYKAKSNDNKCFGTYDERTDTFTCMQYVEGKGKFQPFELQNFLWSEDDGKYARGNGNVEVFCKELHYKK